MLASVRAFLLLLCALVGACGHRAASCGRVLPCSPCPQRAEAVHRLDMMSFPLAMEKEEWLRRLGPLDGQLVEVVGCAVGMGPTRKWSDGFLVWPLRYCPDLLRRQPPKELATLTGTRVLAVRLAPDHAPIPWPKPQVRVRGRLRLGDVRHLSWLEAWADLEDAHVIVLAAMPRD